MSTNTKTNTATNKDNSNELKTYKDLINEFIKRDGYIVASKKLKADSILKDFDYINYGLDILKLNIRKDMDNLRVLELVDVKKDLLISINSVTTSITNELKNMLDEDQKKETYNDIKESLLSIKKNINLNISNLDNILESIKKCTAIQQQTFLKMKGFAKWSTPIIKRNPNTYEIQGFTNNGTVIITTSGVAYNIEVYPLFFNCNAKSKHFARLTDSEKDIIEKEVKKQLGACNGNDLDVIISVQQEIQKELEKKKQQSKNESWNKKFNKIKEQKF